ncbi:MAG TPA: cytochrome c oxidase assembly protein [Actinomycetota bacterium]|nr:cytochrome c oxidase assembly protein [Actinomycetota bacterium]
MIAGEPLRWSLDPVALAGLLMAGWLYARGVRRLWAGGHAGRGIRLRHVTAFVGGLLAVAAALATPLDGLANELLSAHMVQHVLLMVVAAPLLVVGRAGLAFEAAAGPRVRRRLHRLVAPLAPIGRAVVHPVVVWFLAVAALWTWHLPSLYDTALASQPVHVLEHASFLGASLLFWWIALAPSGPRRLPRGFDVLFVATGMFPGSVLGALLTMAPAPIYPFYVVATTRWGASPLADQQAAGAIMWVPSFGVYLVAAAMLFVGWLRASEREARRREGALGLQPVGPVR